MKIRELEIEGVFEIQLEPITDERGFFMRTYDNEIFHKPGLDNNWVQENHSLSLDKGVIRGMHFQFPPYAETKIIRVLSGKILDVFIDLRKDSSTFGKWGSIELSAKNKKMIYIPRGFAHGFCTLTDNCELLYKMDNYYAPDSAYTLQWNDPDIGIDWPIKNPILSEKDTRAKEFKDFVEEYGGLDV